MYIVIEIKINKMSLFHANSKDTRLQEDFCLNEKELKNTRK
jgi:hypothetical protein